MNKLLLFIMICMSQLFADLIHPPNGSELNYVHVLFRWETENNIAFYEFFEIRARYTSLVTSHKFSD